MWIVSCMGCQDARTGVHELLTSRAGQVGERGRKRGKERERTREREREGVGAKRRSSRAGCEWCQVPRASLEAICLTKILFTVMRGSCQPCITISFACSAQRKSLFSLCLSDSLPLSLSPPPLSLPILFVRALFFSSSSTPTSHSLVSLSPSLHPLALFLFLSEPSFPCMSPANSHQGGDAGTRRP